MHEPHKASSDDAMHGPPSSLLRVAQQLALEHSERRTSYIGRFSGLIEGKYFRVVQQLKIVQVLSFLVEHR